MKNSIKSLLLTALVLCSSVTSFAENMEDSDYAKEEGRLMFKIRGFGTSTKATQKGLPAPTSATPRPVGKMLLQNGYGLDTATTIFLNDNIAAEMSLGLMVFNVKGAALNDIANNYNGTSIANKSRNVFLIPLSLTAQYHIAPFGGIRPYLGAGYHVSYALTTAKEFKIGNSSGPVLQAGIDFVAKDDTIITLDVRQFFDKFKVTYKPILVNNVSSNFKLNSLVVSIGVGFKL